jgi:hypothetical protein
MFVGKARGAPERREKIALKMRNLCGYQFSKQAFAKFLRKKVLNFKIAKTELSFLIGLS